MTKKQKGNILFFIYLIVLVFPMLEISLRIVGYKPYNQIPFTIESNPEFCILPDSNLGFNLMPGEFQITINEGLTFSLAHNSDSHRITSFVQDSITRPEIFIMGCSYTYGFGNDDSLTFPFLLQKQLPAYKLTNFGVPGYGTVQSFLQLEKALNKGQIPEVVVINYADFHDDRNALTPQYRRDLHLGFLRSNENLRNIMEPSQIPYLEEYGEFYLVQKEPWSQVYQIWKGSESWAIVNFFQIMDDQISLLGENKQDASLAAFQNIQQLCLQNQIRLIITGLTKNDKTLEMLDRLAKSGMTPVDISLDLTDEKYNHLPYDSHPNEAAHAYFAKRLVEYLEVNIDK